MSKVMRSFIWKITRFFNWNKKSEMHYRVFGTYKDLPRSWEVGVNLTNNLGRGLGIFKSLSQSFKHKWVIR